MDEQGYAADRGTLVEPLQSQRPVRRDRRSVS
jgi:hypothetical protein